MQQACANMKSQYRTSLTLQRRVISSLFPCKGRPCVARRAEPEDKPDGSVESLFSKELKRRGIASIDEDDAPSAKSAPGAAAPGAAGGPPAGGTNPFAPGTGTGSTTRTRPRAPPPPMAAGFSGPGAAPAGEDDQRQRSISLVNEGLSGLIPRASQLLQLGGSVFLGFLPFMIAFSLLFSGIFWVFGASFVHGGRPGSGPPPYVDPERLLSEPTVDPYVPYDRNPYSAPDLR